MFVIYISFNLNYHMFFIDMYMVINVWIFSPNFFILDEPTNHLDMETIEALGEALTKFGVGTWSIVTLIGGSKPLNRVINGTRYMWFCRWFKFSTVKYVKLNQCYQLPHPLVFFCTLTLVICVTSAFVISAKVFIK